LKQKIVEKKVGEKISSFFTKFKQPKNNNANAEPGIPDKEEEEDKK
jgi:hypothetical protein